MTQAPSGKILRLLRHRIAPLISFSLLIIAAVAAVAQQPARKIGKIEFVGLVRLSPQDVIKTSGLKSGDVFSVEALDAAGEKLANSGLFGRVSYRTITTGNVVTIVFQVEETRGGESPVVFDNFVWFSNDELVAAIRREVPSFNGNAPDAGNMTDTIRTALQSLLKERKIDATIEYSPWQDSIHSKQEHLFSVTGIPIPICALHFPGAKNVEEERLVKASKQFTDADYSKKSAEAFGNLILFPIYREAGQWHARFAQPVVKLQDSADCKNGVDVTIPVEEGPVYLWDKAQWTGNLSLPTEELDFALGMKPGEPANGARFDRGVLNIAKTYGHIGHLEATVKAEPVFDDAGSRLSFKMAVKEGPQYKMGTLIIKGLSGSDKEALEQQWKLKYGEVFNTDYINTFLRIDARDVLSRIFLASQATGKEPPRIEPDIKTKSQTLTADVILQFKY